MEFLGDDWVHDWDPDYPLTDRSSDKENQPVSPDAWADEDYEGDY